MSAPFTFAGPSHDDGLRQWVGSRLGTPAESFGPSTAMGVLSDGKIIAAVVYNSYRPAPHGGSMQGSFAADDPRWATRGVLGSMFAYVFSQLGCARFWVEIAKPNKRARRFVQRLGFVYEGCARRAWDGRIDSCVYAMLPSECRWLKYYRPPAEVRLASGF